MPTSPKHIALFTECYLPVGNGVVRSVQTLTKGLQAAGKEVSIVAPEFPDYEDTESHIYRLPSLPAIPYPLTNLAAVNRINTIVDPIQADIIHTHHPFLIGRTGLREAERRQIPLISTAHTRYDLYSHHIPLVPEVATQAVTEQLIRWYYNRCSTVITPSEDTLQYLRRSGVETPITVIPTGVPLPNPDLLTKKAQEKILAKLKIPQDAHILLCVGRITSEKSPEIALGAFLALEKEFPNLYLVFVGSGPLEEELSSKHPRVQVSGWLEQDELIPLYAAATLLLLPSKTETQGLVINEAQACGTPAIVSSLGGAAEVVEDGITGLRVKPSVEAFTAATRRILKDPKKQAAMAEKSIAAAQLSTPDHMTERILEVYAQAKPISA